MTEAEIVIEGDRLSFMEVFVDTHRALSKIGLPLIEAMALGKSVLTANILSLPEVSDDAALLVDPYSIESISRGIIALRSKPAFSPCRAGSPASQIFLCEGIWCPPKSLYAPIV
jgi:glycosyltransferase involved in cell wall biosynthesis